VSMVAIATFVDKAQTTTDEPDVNLFGRVRPISIYLCGRLRSSC